jgi:hypothetical protein
VNQPWEDEPTEVDTTWIAHGLTCRIRRTPRTGALCGYVAIPEDHPGRDDDWDVHGGITFNGQFSDGDDTWWIGFDCAHAFDVMPNLRIGLDSSCTYWTIPMVTAETERLAAQIAAGKSTR